MSYRALGYALCALIAIPACENRNESPDGGPSVDLGAQPADQGLADQGGDPDLGADQGAADSGALDQGELDLGLDLGGPDLGGQDLGAPDTGDVDLGQPDLGDPDLGSPDLGPPDLGPPVVCGDGVVDPATELCDPGLNACCAADCQSVLPQDASCRAQAGSCDVEEVCDGQSADCPADQFEPDFTPCIGCVGTSSTTCLGCYQGSCAPYTSPCLQILNAGQSTGDGIYMIPMTQTGTSAMPVFCDMTTDGGGWTMLYKKSAGVPGRSYELWTSTGTNAMDQTLLDRERETIDYASPFISRIWPAFTEARLEVMTGTVAVRTLHFDTTGSDSLNWFAPDRTTQSTWTDLPTDPNWQNNNGRYFSILGSTARNWYINATWGGCPSDTGWLMVTHTNFCYWEGRSVDAPSEIIYSPVNTVASVPNGFTYADALIVFAR